MGHRTQRRALRSYAACLGAALVALVAPGCRRARTQITLRLDTDMAPQGPGGALESVLVRVYSRPTVGEGGALGGELRHELEYPLAVSAVRPALPTDLALVPLEGGAGGTVGVELQARAGGRELFTTRAIASYVREQHVVLEMYLADRCRSEAARCDPRNTTCSREGCVPLVREALPSIDAGPAGADAGLDALAAPDALDAGPPDAGPPDAPDASDEGAPCPAGQARCAGACVALGEDLSNCGACGVVCAAGERCGAGGCAVERQAFTIASDGDDTVEAVAVAGDLRCAAGYYAGALYLNNVPVPGLQSGRIYLACFDPAGRTRLVRAVEVLGDATVRTLMIMPRAGGEPMVCMGGGARGTLRWLPSTMSDPDPSMGLDGWVRCVGADGSEVNSSGLFGSAADDEVFWLGHARAWPANDGALSMLIGYGAPFALGEGMALFPAPVRRDAALFGASLGRTASFRVQRWLSGPGDDELHGLYEVRVGASDGALLYGATSGGGQVGTSARSGGLAMNPGYFLALAAGAGAEVQWARSFEAPTAAPVFAAPLGTSGAALVATLPESSVGLLRGTPVGRDDLALHGLSFSGGAVLGAMQLWGSPGDDAACGLAVTSRGVVLGATYQGAVAAHGTSAGFDSGAVQGTALLRLSAAGAVAAQRPMSASAGVALRCGALASDGSSAVLVGLTAVRRSSGDFSVEGITRTGRSGTDAVLLWTTPEF